MTYLANPWLTDSSTLFGAGTSATEPRALIMDGAEVCLEQGEQAADFHFQPLGEELQELIQTSLAQSHQFQSSHHTRNQHIVSSMDHLVALAASLEEGNPAPISIPLSHTVSSSLADFLSGTCPVPSDDSSLDTFVSEDRGDHDDSIVHGPC